MKFACCVRDGSPCSRVGGPTASACRSTALTWPTSPSPRDRTLGVMFDRSRRACHLGEGGWWRTRPGAGPRPDPRCLASQARSTRGFAKVGGAPPTLAQRRPARPTTRRGEGFFNSYSVEPSSPQRSLVGQPAPGHHSAFERRSTAVRPGGAGRRTGGGRGRTGSLRPARWYRTARVASGGRCPEIPGRRPMAAAAADSAGGVGWSGDVGRWEHRGARAGAFDLSTAPATAGGPRGGKPPGEWYIDDVRRPNGC